MNLSEYEDYTGAYGQLGRCPDEVDTPKRIHSSLAYLNPAEFACPALGGEAQCLTE